MAGYGLPKEQHLSVVLQNSLELEGHNIKIINGSVSGSTSAGGLNIAEWTLSENNIDLMILCLGANDMLRGLDPTTIKKNLKNILLILREKNISTLLAGMLAPNTYGEEYKTNFNAIYPELAEKYNVSFLPFLLEGVALIPKYNLDDGKHPNHKGVELISENLERKLIKLLNK